MDQSIIQPPTIPQIPVSPEPVKKPFPKWLLILLIVLILSVISVFAWQKYQSSRTLLVGPSPSPFVSPELSVEAEDPTAGWKQIIGKNWTLKIPMDWHYLECQPGNSMFINPESIHEKDNQTIECNFGPTAAIWITKEQANYKIPTAFKTQNTSEDFQSEELSLTVSDRMKIGVDGKQGVFQKEEYIGGMNEGIQYSSYVIHNDNMYIFTVSDESLVDQYNLILSTFKFTDAETDTNLPNGWTYYTNPGCPVKLPLPPKEVINTRTWQGEGWNSADFLGFFKGNTVRVIHRNPEEASGFISGLVEVICGLNSSNLEKINSDFNVYLKTSASQATIPEGVIELTANNDVIQWGYPAKEMNFTGGMFDPNQKYYLLVVEDKWYIISQKSNSTYSEIQQQTNQIFNLLKFKE